MRAVLLLILSFISVAVTQAHTESYNKGGISSYGNAVPMHSEQDRIAFPDSVRELTDTLNAALKNAFVISRHDTFPIQVGAYRNKSNAERISSGLRELFSMKVKVFIEDGLYKVRITRTPDEDIVQPGSANVRIAQAAAIQLAPGTADTITDSSVFRDFLYLASGRDTDRMSDSSQGSDDGMILFKSGSPWMTRIKYFGESFALVNALIITILFSISTMIILLIIILLNRRRLEKEARVHQYLMEKYQNLIVDYLYGNASADDFRSIASNDYSRQVLIDQMIDVSVNLKGEESKKLFSLYKHLGLERDSLARARDYRWHKKIKGFRELAFMNIKDANDSIYKALNSSNEILRMEAQIALVRLSDENHFEFLYSLKRPFSLWEQITLHDLIIQHNIPVPDFKQWLNSSNDSVVIFSLRMIREFKQMDAEEHVRNNLYHSSPAVRLLAVQVAGDLRFTSTTEILKRMYKNQDYKTCLEIVRAMGKMADTSMLGFLQLVLDKEDDVQLQIEATKSIEKMGEEGVKALVKIMKSEYKNYNIIVRHVLDRRIN